MISIHELSEFPRQQSASTLNAVMMKCQVAFVMLWKRGQGQPDGKKPTMILNESNPYFFLLLPSVISKWYVDLTTHHATIVSIVTYNYNILLLLGAT